MNSRRNFLRGPASTGIAAATLAAFPPSIRRALAIEANNVTGTIADVEHIVVLMQENRSFDHYFGTLKGVRGFGDRFPIPLPGNKVVWEQGDAAGNVLMPFHLDGSVGNAQRTGGTPHTWVDGQNAWANGRLVEWPRYKTAKSMGYLKEAELPFQFALANAFTLCDAYHCSMHTGTGSNRMFLWTGSNGPSAGSGSTVNNEWTAIAPSTNGFNWTTYPERLEAAGISWLVYQNMPDNYTDNPLAGFKQYRAANEASGKPVKASGASPAYDPASDDVGNPLYKGIANTMPDGGFLQTFKDDVKNGKLRQVTWIVAPANYSEHPGPSSPVQGAWYTQEVLDALTAVPEVWSKTVLFVNFDENDGFFDHVPSPSPPTRDASGQAAGKTTLPESALDVEYYTQPPAAGTSNQPARDGRVYGPGMRVPMYVVSPWSRGGWVNSQAFDHTSVIRFIEARFGVGEPNISPFRRAVCGDLTSAFNFATPNSELLPTLNGRKLRSEADALRTEQQGMAAITPPSDQSFPRQETGTRPSRALPYELHTSARADAVGGVVRLLFANTGRQAAVFHVYDRLNLDRVPRRYMVEAGKSLDDVWNAATDNAGLYDLWVLGPNGYHRQFKGDLNALRTSDAPNAEVRVCYDVANGNVYLSMMNAGRRALAFSIRAKAYRADGPWTVQVAPAGQQELHWSLADSGRWYDFEVTCDSDPNWMRRFAGRVETGAASVSDPAMGTISP
ncbi:phospholipase C, phosphocholine-specific [Variovorax dokdonensis]|uniref:phospholipase C n=1 Tax=Variovorax dokdonensis TaxID=344883 RepID=A0ABT7NAL9_9BURK|nr:phospholipase C, phosphocholine-specific [Variovorax dokdonensis]MDM0044984.1 phospholipase C, phosphocholine-specific [Variovorax dokdonensis]